MLFDLATARLVELHAARGEQAGPDGGLGPPSGLDPGLADSARLPDEECRARLEGLSDREAVERYSFDARWRYAAGVGSYDCGGWGSFAHTVLVDMQARLAASADRRRIFNLTVEAASQAGLASARVLDSTPLYDAVATMDSITLIRSAMRGVLEVADPELEGELRGLLTSGDDYASSAKPHIDWDDQAAREELIDSRARDGNALLAYFDDANWNAGSPRRSSCWRRCWARTSRPQTTADSVSPAGSPPTR